jgi:peptidoglycan hydrolase-like protein with peptidoglycan-binding domain
LQADLVDLGFDLGTIDGRFGDLTFEAVERFQGKHGLTVDGKAGPKTLRAITAALKTEPSAAPDQPAKLSIGIVGALIKALINLLSNWRN